MKISDKIYDKYFIPTTYISLSVAWLMGFLGHKEIAFTIFGMYLVLAVGLIILKS